MLKLRCTTCLADLPEPEEVEAMTLAERLDRVERDGGRVVGDRTDPEEIECPSCAGSHNGQPVRR